MLRDGPERFLVFGVGSERFAVALRAVDEVIDAPPARPIPDAPRSVVGVSTVRGELVTLFDLGAMLNVEAKSREAVLLFSRADADRALPRRVGLVIDAVDDAIVVEPDEVQAAPGAYTGDLLLGLLQRDGDLIALLDARAVLESAMLMQVGPAGADSAGDPS